MQISMAASAFLANALPITANITHTPPPLIDVNANANANEKEKDSDEAMVSTTTADTGFISGLKLLTTTFQTGSYGWKGNKRVMVEIKNEKGEMEKVPVQVT